MEIEKIRERVAQIEEEKSRQTGTGKFVFDDIPEVDEDTGYALCSLMQNRVLEKGLMERLPEGSEERALFAQYREIANEAVNRLINALVGAPARRENGKKTVSDAAEQQVELMKMILSKFQEIEEQRPVLDKDADEADQKILQVSLNAEKLQVLQEFIKKMVADSPAVSKIFHLFANAHTQNTLLLLSMYREAISFTRDVWGES